jgi:hypothetical protein
MEHLPVQALPEATSTYVALAESGQVFVVVRHSDPLALLRPPDLEDVAEDVPVSRFRTDLRAWLQRSRGSRLRLTWHGRRVAVVEGFPAEDRHS